MHPKISIIIPAYNVAAYIGEALRSVLAQSYTDYEIIVVNDGSTDAVEQALAPFMRQIVYIRQENRGLSAARNAGLKRARGEFIALLDADDIWLPQYLERMLDLLQSEARPDVVYPNAILFGLPRWEGRLFQDIYPSAAPVTVESLLARECTVFVSVMFRRALLDEVGTFDEEIRWGGEDFDLWLRMARHGCRFAFTSEALVKYRKRADSLSSSEERTARSGLYIAEKVLADPGYTPREAALAATLAAESKAALYKAQARRLILERDFSGAARRLSQANAHYRSFKLTLAGVMLRISPDLVARVVERQLKEPDGRETIAFFENGISFGGAVTCLATLIRALDQRRFRAVVLSSHNDADSRQAIEQVGGEFLLVRQYRRSKKLDELSRRIGEGARLVKYPLLLLLLLYETTLRCWYGLRAWLLLSQQSVHLVHLNNSMASNVEGIVAAKLLRVKCVLHLRGYEYRSVENRIAARWIDYFIAMSESVADSLYRLEIPRDKVQVIYDGIDARESQVRAAEPFSNGAWDFAQVNVGVVGTLIPWKGQRVFIEAAAILINEMKVRNCRFFIIGGEVPGDEAYRRELETLAEDARLGDALVFAGHQENVFRFLNRLDVMAHTSLLPEPFGRVIIEAMSLARPVIATRMGGPLEIIEHGQDGLLVRENDPRQLAEAIYDLISNSERRLQMAEEARRKVETRFALDRFARELELVYTRLN